MTSTITTTLTVLEAGDPGWDEARQAFNLTVDQRPVAIARPTSAVETQAAVGYAREHGLRVAAQSTGHNAAPLGDLSDTLLLKTDAMRQVTVDAEKQTAWAEAGARWEDVVGAAAPHGLAALAGSAPNVGVAGYTLGGGMSWLGRKFGFASNNVASLEVVTADGRLRRVDADTEPDLFWALRGGGGSFAVVTAIELRLFPLTRVTAGLLWWPLEAALPVLNAWGELTQSAVPDELLTTVRLIRFPDLPEVPDPVRGGAFVVVDVIHQGDEAEARALLEPVLRLGPATDTVAEIPVPQLAGLHMDPEEPVPFAGHGLVLEDLPAGAIHELVRLAGPAAVEAPPIVELRHAGGAFRRSAPDHGALDTLEGEYVAFAGGGVPTPEAAAVVDRGIKAFRVALTPWVADQTYLNFTESPRDPAGFWSPEAYARLRTVKADVDPDNLIRANHEVPAAGTEAAR